MSMMSEPMGAGPAGPPPSIQVPAPPEEQSPMDDPEVDNDPVTVLQSLVEAAMHYMQVEKDEVDKAKGAQALKIYQDLLAVNQKQQDQAQGTSPQFAFARKKGLIGAS